VPATVPVVRRRLLVPALLAGCLGALPAPAAAQNRLFQDYRRDGVINPCSYSRGELQRGLQGLPPDVEQYVPGLSDQLRRSCAGAPAPAAPTQPEEPAAVVPPSTGGAPPPPPKSRVVVPRPPAPRVSAPKPVAGVAPKVDAGPIGILPDWLAGVLAALAAGGLATVLAMRYGLGDGGFPRSLRASVLEAGERTGDALAQVWDRLRLGR
jgi:hypothetical protein